MIFTFQTSMIPTYLFYLCVFITICTSSVVRTKTTPHLDGGKILLNNSVQSREIGLLVYTKYQIQFPILFSGVNLSLNVIKKICPRRVPLGERGKEHARRGTVDDGRQGEEATWYSKKGLIGLGRTLYLL